MAKCLFLCSSSNSCLQSNPREVLFLFSTLDIFITLTCREALWFISRQFILGTDNSLKPWHCLQLPSEGYSLEWLHQARAGKHKPWAVEERQQGLPESIILFQPGTRVHSVQSHPKIKIWEPPSQHLPAGCTSAAACPLSEAQCCGSQPHSATAVIKAPSPLIHSLQNTEAFLL